MEKYVAEKILQVQERLLEDAEYQALLAEHEVLNARFLEMVEGMNVDQKTAVFDYLGLLVELNTKMLAACCTEKAPEG